MVPAGTPCASCGFDNPRAWHACARCGRPLTGPGASPAATADATRVDLAAPGGAADRTAVDLRAPTDVTEPDLEVPSQPLVADTEAPLIGQGEASAALRRTLERAWSTAHASLALLEGPRGSGKTRLLVHASELAARDDPDVRLLYGSCREGGGDGSYTPFSRIVLDQFGVTPSTAPGTARAHVSERVSAVLGPDGTDDAPEVIHLLGHLAGIPFPESPLLARLEERPEELHERTVTALRRWLEGEARRGPLLLLLDDFHHAEEEAWQVLGGLVADAAGRLAIVAAGHAPLAERAGGIEPAGEVEVAPVAPLGEAEVAELLHVLLPSLHEVPESFVTALTHRSGGNPAAVRELVLALDEHGVFLDELEGLRVDLERFAAADLPVSTRDAIRARLDRLDEVERATLERAAIVGERFWDSAVLAQMRSEREPPGLSAEPLSIWPDDRDADNLAAIISRLHHKGFVIPAELSDLPGATEYTFAVAQTRAMLYEAIEPELRIHRHGAVGRWLSVVAEIRREGVAAMIAPHLELAGERRRAGRAYLEAAIYERAQLRTTAALRYVERALELIPREDVVRRIDALHERGSLLTTLGRYDGALASLTDMLQLAWSIGARGKGGAALNRIARVHRQRGADVQARTHLARALELFRRAGDLRGVAATLDDLSHIHVRQGEVEQALATATEALEIRRAHGDRRGEALSLHNVAQAELVRGRLDEAERLLSEAASLRRALSDHEGILQSENLLGIVAFEHGDRDRAIASWEAALEQAREMADRRSESVLLNNLGEALRAAGRFDEAGERLERARELSSALGDRRAAADVERNLGLLAVAEGDERAEAILHRAKELAEEYGSVESIALAHRALGTLYARTLFDSEGGADRKAEEAFLASIDMFREIGNEKEAARSLAELGRHLLERGDEDAARERLYEARAIMRRMGLADGEQVERTLTELE